MTSILAASNAVTQYVLGSILLLLTVVLVFLILKQTGKNEGLSGTISGASSDTYFGKNSGATKDRIYNKITIACSILFVIVAAVLVVVVMKNA